LKEKRVVTSYIKHLAVSGLSGILARIKSSCSLTGNRPQSATKTYRQPLGVSPKKQNGNK